MQKPEVRISVRNLVEFILRSGDLDLTTVVSSKRMQEGTRIHRKLQKEAGEGYQAEVRLSLRREFAEYDLLVEGIADGVFTGEDGETIDEIKTTGTPLEQIDFDYNGLHWAQAKCYAYMHAVRSGLGNICIRLTYYNMETRKTKHLAKGFLFSELEEYFTSLTDKYSIWAAFSVEQQRIRNLSIRRLGFPFREYRAGQKELASAVYRTIRDRRKIFAQAPTGTGKTMSVLFPSVKALGEGLGEKLFYLTAKTVTRQVAEKAVLLMQEKGLVLKAITLTSKEKCCPCPESECRPEECSRALGHYDRVNAAIFEILKNETVITREILADYAGRYGVCPFEYSLDVALWMDLVICDYNYAFDPRASLKRFFEYGGDYTLLVDEAHNLVDRAREMFSAELLKSAFLEARKHTKSLSAGLHKVVTGINKYFIGLRKTFEKGSETRVIDPPEELYHAVEDFLEEFDTLLARGRGAGVGNLLELYFECLAFVAVYRLCDERYAVFAVREGQDVRVKLFCLDPSYLLGKTCAKVRSSVFFSATLMPLNYFRDILGGGPEEYTMRLPSPFDRDHLCLMAAGNISTRYKDREGSYEAVSDYIRAAVGGKTGNYLVFFPSFEYMKRVHELYTAEEQPERVMLQAGSMDDAERADFLSRFEEQPETSLVAFAVMGGIFSEGIDLAGDRLSGAVIVGVGLPQVCAERDIISRYFREKNGQGFEFSYMYPGMNRVLQAAGRVIRTESDRGFVLLLDERFLHRRYLELFPAEWEGYRRVFSPEGVSDMISLFWKKL